MVEGSKMDFLSLHFLINSLLTYYDNKKVLDRSTLFVVGKYP